MTKLSQIFCLSLCLAGAGLCQAAGSDQPTPGDTMADQATATLPNWQVLEFEQKAFWAVARSRLEVMPVADDPQLWELDVLNSVVQNSEQITVRFDPATGRAVTRSRLSRGKEQRMKTYQYEADFILRDRRNPGADPGVPADQWPIANSKKVPYPDTQEVPRPVVTSPYVLVLLAQRLQAQGDDKSLELLVHTDLNFYRLRLSSGNGIPIDVDYQQNGSERVQSKTNTSAVVVHATPVGTPEEEPDFSLFGLHGDIILFFDRNSGLPLQIRGIAPRIGSTSINLKSVTLRAAAQ